MKDSIISMKELCETKFGGDRMQLAKAIGISRAAIDNYYNTKKVCRLKDGRYMTVSAYDVTFKV